MKTPLHPYERAVPAAIPCLITTVEVQEVCYVELFGGPKHFPHIGIGPVTYGDDFVAGTVIMR